MKDAKRLMRKAWATAAMGKPLRPSMRYMGDEVVLAVAESSAHLADTYAALSGVPDEATVLGSTFTWDSFADYFFAQTGPMQSMIPKYTPRKGQVQMSRVVERALQMRDVAVINAPTGTGKSLAYLVQALEMKADKPVIISTSSKALQGQILDSDMPLLRSVYPDASVVVMKGRTNYVCERKLESYDLPKHIEYMIPDSGLIDELQIDIEDRKGIQVESGTVCKGCPLRPDCRYQKHRTEAKNADIVIVNHAILSIHLFTQNLLPDPAAYIVDEAHKFEQSARSNLAIEVTKGALSALGDRMSNNIECQAMPSVVDFWKEVEYAQTDDDGDMDPDVEIEVGKELSARLRGIATKLWYEDDIPENNEAAASAALASAIRSMADRVESVSVAPSRDHCRWATVDQHGIIEGVQVSPLEVADLISQAIGYEEMIYQCSRCREKVEPPYYVFRQQFICRWCRDDIEKGLEQCDGRQADRRPNSPAWIFTSATMAVAGDTAEFRSSLGIKSAMNAVVESPFNYGETTMLYIAKDLPEPSTGTHTARAADRALELIQASQGGALILYASQRAMTDASMQIGPQLEAMGLQVMVQGETPKTEIIETMRENASCVTFGLASFREGVDIAGLNLRLLIIDKLFFSSPTPYSRSRERALNEWAAEQGYTGYALEFYAFNQIAVVEMILEMQQAAGRLNRREDDRGAIVVLDPRAGTKAYGRRLLNALPPATRVELEQVKAYLGQLAIESSANESVNLYVEDDLDL